ncbi:MAG: hypothetical protein AAF411_27265, partial [Myxococcota bacterium]
MRPTDLVSPFPATATPAAEATRSETPRSEMTQYRLHGGGPAVAADAVEGQGLTAEVVVTWGGAPLAVAHVGEGEQFLIGPGTDFPLEGFDKAVAIVDHGHVALPEGASLTEGSAGVVGEGSNVAFALGGLELRVRGVREGKRVAPRRKSLDRQPVLFVGGTMAFAGVILVLMSLMPPHGMAMSSGYVNTDSRLVSVFMDAQEEEALFEPTPDDAGGGDEGGAERGDEGQMGDIEETATNRAYAIEGRARPEERQLSREAQREQASSAGILGVLAASQALNVPTSVYGADTAIGSDPMNALGNLMGANLGDAFGYGGLGLRGTGRHGGGDALGTVGLGEHGIGHGATCSGGGRCEGTQSGVGGPGGPGLRRHEGRT